MVILVPVFPAVDWIQSHYKLTSDENGCLAVLHNRNKMVTTFGNSEWATQSEGSVQSKSVTSCAGMTAHFVLLAQTKVGFLSGGRSKRMKELSHHEFLAQLEEAYARATVALTRAQKLCIIMGCSCRQRLFGAYQSYSAKRTSVLRCRPQHSVPDDSLACSAEWYSLNAFFAYLGLIERLAFHN